MAFPPLKSLLLQPQPGWRRLPERPETALRPFRPHEWPGDVVVCDAAAYPLGQIRENNERRKNHLLFLGEQGTIKTTGKTGLLLGYMAVGIITITIGLLKQDWVWLPLLPNVLYFTVETLRHGPFVTLHPGGVTKKIELFGQLLADAAHLVPGAGGHLQFIILAHELIRRHPDVPLTLQRVINEAKAVLRRYGVDGSLRPNQKDNLSNLLIRLELALRVLGPIFNCNSSNLWRALDRRQHIYIDLTSLSGPSQFLVLMTILQAIHEWLMHRGETDVIDTAILIDECMVGFPRSLDERREIPWVTTFLNTLRSYGCRVVAASQQPSNLLSTLIASSNIMCGRLARGADIIEAADRLGIKRQDARLLLELENLLCVVRFGPVGPTLGRIRPIPHLRANQFTDAHWAAIEENRRRTFDLTTPADIRVDESATPDIAERSPADLTAQEREAMELFASDEHADRLYGTKQCWDLLNLTNEEGRELFRTLADRGLLMTFPWKPFRGKGGVSKVPYPTKAGFVAIGAEPIAMHKRLQEAVAVTLRAKGYDARIEKDGFDVVGKRSRRRISEVVILEIQLHAKPEIVAHVRNAIAYGASAIYVVTLGTAEQRAIQERLAAVFDLARERIRFVRAEVVLGSPDSGANWLRAQE